MSIITVDVETHDPNLKDMGPGDVRKDYHILGVGVQIDDQMPEYFVLNHNGERDDEESIRRLRNILASEDPKLGHNAIGYDVPILVGEGFEVNGKVHDTIIMAALLDEYAPRYTLDALAVKYLGEHKGDDEIEQYAKDRGWKGSPQAHLEKMPIDMVHKYCLKDVEQTKRLCDIFLPKLDGEDIRELYEMEIALSPLLWLMRETGIAIDEKAMHDLGGKLNLELDRLQGELFKTYGEFNTRSGKQIAAILDSKGIPYPKTEKGNPKLGKNELPLIGEMGQMILGVREVQTLLNNFIEGAFPKFLINGRLHPQFLQTKRDEGGTVSGRFSAQKPNLTQVPARSESWGGKIRSLFIPDEGMDLLALDYDGIESRIFAHYASEGDAIRKAYNDNPELDYHQAVADMAGIDRKAAKTINFAALYGAGVTRLAKELGRGEAEGRDILNRYHARFPAVRATMTAVERIVKVRGYLRTVGGRKARLSHQLKAQSRYYLFLNRLIQGSAADLLKKGMLDAWKAGVFDVLNPHLLVHDEVVASVPRTPEGVQAQAELKRCMETAYQFDVPIRVSGGTGKNWAEAH